MNLLDRVIAAIWPTAGLRRASARAAISVVTNKYDAAQPWRSLSSWHTSGASADAEIGGQLPALRARARDLGRNEPFIARGYDVLASNMIGTGVRPRIPEGTPQQIRTRTMDLWSEWADAADVEGRRDIYGLQYLAARTMVESGAAIIRFIPSPGQTIPWRIRILEPDYIDITRNQPLDNGNTIVQGVEFNRAGAPVAYWMYTRHPGSDIFTARSSGDVERVSAEFATMLFHASRPEQTHGVPWVAPVVMAARQLNDLWDARLKRAKTQACFSAFVTKNPDVAQISTDAETGVRRQELAPGSIEYLSPDEGIEFANPPGSEGDDEWQIMLLHSIASGLGLTYAQLTGDLRQVNYSSMRAGLLDFWRRLDVWQQLTIEPLLCRPIWTKFDQVAAVYQRRNRLIGVQWDFPQRQFVDPEKDVAAITAELAAGTRSFPEVLSALGRDPEAHITELEKWNARASALGLSWAPQRPQTPVQDGSTQDEEETADA